MVKAPLNVEASNKIKTKPSNDTSQFNKSSVLLKYSEQNKQVIVMATESPGTGDIVTTLPVITNAPSISVPPIVAVVTPTAHLNNSLTSAVVKPHSNTAQLNPSTTTPFLYHQLSALSLPIPTTVAQAPTSGTWPIPDPVFHFGPGFEPRSMCNTHKKNSQQNEHIVLFHVSPGVSVTFQIGGKHEVVRGKITFYFS